MKLNTDDSVRSRMGVMSVRAVIRELDETIFGCQANKVHDSFSSFMAECLALRQGLLFVKNYGCIQIAEVDATRVVQAVNCGDSLIEEEAVINDILELFSSFHHNGLARLFVVKLIE